MSKENNKPNTDQDGKTVSKGFKENQLSSVFKTRKDLNISWKHIPIGYDKLDETLNGGLIPALYVLGAESSTGKSTFMLNIAEKAALKKIPVMYFSLEMPMDYIARLIICHCLIKEEQGDRRTEEALDRKFAIRNFTNGSDLENLINSYSKTGSPFDKAFNKYREIGKYIYIFERNMDNPNYTANNVFSEVEKFIAYNDQKPIVIVDYLQLLGAESEKLASDRRTVVDNNISRLWQTANGLKVPVITISSVSREGYRAGKKRELELSHLKESGSIEFSADIVWVLQSKDPEAETATVSKNKIKKRDLELKILKNRYGEKSIRVDFSFYPEYGLFTETTPAPQKTDSRTKDPDAPAPQKINSRAETYAPPERQTDTVKKGSDQAKAAEDCAYIFNSRIANYLRTVPQNCGVHTMQISSPNEKRVNVTYCLSKKENIPDDGAESLTLMDCAVMDAVYSVLDSKINSFTVRDLIKFMRGKTDISTISDGMKNNIIKALDRLKNREMAIDITEECEMRGIKYAGQHLMKATEIEELPDGFVKDSDRIILRGTLLPFEKNNTKFLLNDAAEEPILFEYMREISRQFIRYDMRLWQRIEENDGSQKNTQQKFLIRYYLIHEIEVMKYNKKNHSSSREITVYKPYKRNSQSKSLLPLLVLSDSTKMNILEKAGLDIRQFSSHKYFPHWLKSACEDTKMILDDFVKHGYIDQYNDVGKDPETVYEITLPNDPPREKQI